MSKLNVNLHITFKFVNDKNFKYVKMFIFFIVNVKSEIDWNIVNKYQTIENKIPPSPFEINEDDYELALVKPNYRAAPNIYIVTMICDDIRADSSFPDNKFRSYVDYYKEHYSVSIMNSRQHLLEVKSISTKINCIVPRYEHLFRFLIFKNDSLFLSFRTNIMNYFREI